MAERTVWAAGVLAFQQKREGGTDFYHTVLLIHAATREHAAARSMTYLYERCPEADGWGLHQTTVTSMGEPPPVIADSGQAWIEVWSKARHVDPQLRAVVGAADTLSANDWTTMIEQRAHQAYRDLGDGQDGEQLYREGLVRIAVLAMLAIEAFDAGMALQ